MAWIARDKEPYEHYWIFNKIPKRSKDTNEWLKDENDFIQPSWIPNDIAIVILKKELKYKDNPVEIGVINHKNE